MGNQVTYDPGVIIGPKPSTDAGYLLDRLDRLIVAMERIADTLDAQYESESHERAQRAYDEGRGPKPR